ncbi:MAG: hypothetical protein NTV31_01620 [Bacteroidia bacterium]|nr:hypothetical protein [Bacteroidia bacterium]
MKKYLLTLIMLIIILFPLSAQKTKDVLYLKNGSLIYGKLMEVTDSMYKIKTSDGSLFIYSLPEVEKFVNETPLFDGRKKSGLGFVLEAGLLVGAQSSDYDAPFSFNFLANVTSNTKDIIGLGSGVEYLGQPFMPLFLEYKRLLSDRKTTPFIFIRGGKLFHLNGDEQNTDSYYPQYDNPKSYRGGGSFTIGTGISWANEYNETYLSFAYRNVHTSYSQKNYQSQTATYKNSFNRLEIKFGFRF